MSNNDYYNKLSQAKVRVLEYKNTHFFFGLLCRLQHVMDPKFKHIAGTDGVSVTYNPEKFFKYNLEQQAFIATHEVLHVALCHAIRKGDRDHETFNIAADYYINNTLKDAGFTMIPDIYVGRFNGMHTEEIYNILIQEKKEGKSPSTDTGKPNALDGDLDYQDNNAQSNSSGKTADEIAQEVNQVIASVAMEAELAGEAGSIPGEIARYLAELRKPQVLWKPLLLRYLTEVNKSDYSWKKTNRRYLPHDLFMPSLHKETLACLDFAIDVSGSISPKQFVQFVSEVDHVFRTLNPHTLNVMQFDHVLCGFDTVRQVADVANIKFKGGGGTTPQVALTKTQETGAKAIIMLTDGYFNTSDIQDPGKPVIWVVYDNPSFEPPFGVVVPYQLDK